MSLDKFTTGIRRVTVGTKTWLLNGHFRNCDGESRMATAAFLREVRGTHKRVKEALSPSLVRDLCFERPPTVTRPISVRALRKAVGAPTWSKSTWRAKPRKLMGVVFDLVLVRRAVSCIPRDALAVVLEILPFEAHNGQAGHALRIVGNGWLAIVASCTGASAKPLALGKRTAHPISTSHGKDNG